MYRKKVTILFAMMMMLSAQSALASPLDALLNSYQAEGAAQFSAQRGKQFWATKHADKKGGPARSCSACHSNDLTRMGKHIRTGKVIKPMAPSVNAARLTKARKMKKWLHRNCKWVLGRTCTAQEKGDILTFIKTFK